MVKTNSKNRLGEIANNKNGTQMKIIRYESSHNIIVQFLDSHQVKVKTSYGNFSKGEVRNPYDKTVFGIGYLGEGCYKTKINGKQTCEYTCWKRMMQRCYDVNYQLLYPTYKNCIVYDEWHNFQIFAKWYNENFYQIRNKTMCLDKDILHKGNKIYSPENCIFVPNEINCCIINRHNYRGNLPIGVTMNGNMYTAQCSDINNKRRFLGNYNSPIEAFQAYKNQKEKIIIEIANQYKLQVPDNLYNALVNYKIDITD